ncbi:MAG: TPM domain-containing protein [Deltaproteobacteria bacterium]|nr:TPM domain-containing protein [Deltaproteobacteria bacterium]
MAPRRGGWLPAAALALGLAAACLPASQRGAIPPAPRQWVTDHAGFLSPATRARLDERLAAAERTTGNQIIVYIDRSIGSASLEEWAARAFEAWGVGRKGLDNGAVLFVLADDRKARIEVGYGLEDRIPDAVAVRIVRDVLIPRIQAGDRDGAVEAAVERMLAAAAPEAPSSSAPGQPGAARTTGPPRPRAPSPMETALLVLVGIALLVLFATNPTLAVWLLINLASGGRAGGRRGGGGGFSGGGGRSGGGGASGSW